MRKWPWIVVLVLVAVPMFVAPQTSEAQWRRHYRPWGYPYGYGYGYPYGWEYPYSYPYPYYNPPPVIVVPPEQPQQPQPYMQQQPQQPQQSQQQYWYFCKNPEGYYPYIKECPGGFLQVVPQTVPPPSAPGAGAQR